MNPHNKHANYKNALTYVYYVFQWNMDNILYDIISSKIHMVTVIYLSSSFAVVVLGVRSYTGCHWNIPWTELETMQGCGWNCWGNAATGGVGLCHGAPSDWEVDLGGNFNNFFGIKWLQHKNPYIYIYILMLFLRMEKIVLTRRLSRLAHVLLFNVRLKKTQEICFFWPAHCSTCFVIFNLWEWRDFKGTCASIY